MANYQEARELPHELFLTTREKTKVRNAFPKNVSTDITLSKAQISKIIQSGNLGKKKKKTLINVAVLLARDNLPGLVSNLASNVINKFKRKIIAKGAVSAGKDLFYLFRVKI